MGLQVRAAQDATVQGNTNDICCTRKQGIILPARYSAPRSPFAIVSSRRGEWLREAGRQRERQSLPTDPGCFEPAFVFFRRSHRLSWESLTDSSLYASLLCDSYHTTEASVLGSSSPSYSEGWKYIFPHCIQTRVCHSPHVWRRNENHQNEIHKKKRQSNQIGVKVRVEFSSRPDMENGHRAVFLGHIKGKDS